MEEKPLTEEQKSKIKKLYLKFLLSSMLAGFKFAALLLLANITIGLINALYVQNQAFATISGIVTTVFLIASCMNASEKAHDRLREEYKKILES